MLSFHRFCLDLKITRGAGTDTQQIYVLPKECFHGQLQQAEQDGNVQPCLPEVKCFKRNVISLWKDTTDFYCIFYVP